MKMWSVFLIAGALALPMSAAVSQATLPKEGEIAITAVFHATVRHVAMGLDLYHATYETVGGWAADKAGGFGDRLTVRCVGSTRAAKGTIESDASTCEAVDIAGDKLYYTYAYTRPAADRPGATMVRAKLVGGTGKYAGISGEGEVIRRPHRPPSDNETVVSVRLKGTYKLP